MISRKFNKVFRKSKKKRKEKMEIKKTLRMIISGIMKITINWFTQNKLKVYVLQKSTSFELL